MENTGMPRGFARAIERPVNSITLMAACEAAHVPFSVGRRAVQMRLLFTMGDAAGTVFVSPDAVSILMDLARRPMMPARMRVIA
jgi:hypothetical protein